MTEPNHFGNFERGSYEEQVCEISFNIGQRFKEMRFKYVSILALVTIVFGGARLCSIWWRALFFSNLDQHFRRSFPLKIYSFFHFDISFA